MARHVPMPDGSPCWCAVCEAERRVMAAETKEERAFWDRYERGWARARGDTGKLSVGAPGTGLDDPGPQNPYTPHGGSWSEGILERSWEAEQDEEERVRKR